jgi:hypothetical protein
MAVNNFPDNWRDQPDKHFNSDPSILINPGVVQEFERVKLEKDFFKQKLVKVKIGEIFNHENVCMWLNFSDELKILKREGRSTNRTPMWLLLDKTILQVHSELGNDFQLATMDGFAGNAFYATADTGYAWEHC